LVAIGHTPGAAIYWMAMAIGWRSMAMLQSHSHWHRHLPLVRQTSGLAVSYLHCPIIQLPHQSRPAHAGPPRKAGCHLWLLKMRVSVRLAGVYREVLNIF